MEARGKHSSEPNVSQEKKGENEPSTSQGDGRVTVQLRRRRPRTTVSQDTRKVAKKSEKQRNALDPPDRKSSTSEEGISLLKQKGKPPTLNTAKRRIAIKISLKIAKK
jgi:pyridoxine 5'-phosphate synthase PdxJ